MNMVVTSRTVAWLLAGAFVVASSARGYADETPEALRQTVERGTVAYGLGNFAAAAEAWEQAFAIRPEPALLYNAAQAHRLAGNKPRALMLYQNLVRLYSKFAYRNEVLRRIKSLEKAIESDKRVATSLPVRPIAPLEMTTPAPSLLSMKSEAPVAAPPTGASPEARDTTPPLALPAAVLSAAPDAQNDVRKDVIRPAAYAPWIALGLAVGLGAAGVYFGARVMDSSVNYDDSRSLATGATVCLVLAGTGAVTAAGLWLWRYLARPRISQSNSAAGTRIAPFAIVF